MTADQARSITINADMGEGVGIHSFGHDDSLLGLVDTINLACGVHAGGPHQMADTVAKAVAAEVSIGAHPGLPDLAGFGRRTMDLSAREVRDLVLYQVGSLTGFLTDAGAVLHHIKPHGALYSMVARDEQLMEAVCDVAELYGVPVFGLPGTIHERVAGRRGVELVAEFYVDLDYADDGTLVIARRGAPRDLDDVEHRARRAIESGTTGTTSGGVVDVRVESLCVHSDLPNAPSVARLLRSLVGPRPGISRPEEVATGPG
jgi:5-oxoprolinase (ATP-hydrolysing) subunit A